MTACSTPSRRTGFMKGRDSGNLAGLHLVRMAGGFGVVATAGIALSVLIALVTVLQPFHVRVPPSFPAKRAACTSSAMQIVAHADDDLIFQSPDVLHDIEAGRCVRTVYVTAGDAAKDDLYWKGREEGSRAAYAQMAGVPNIWTTADAGVPGRSIQLETLDGAPGISIVSMRLPDGSRAGAGMLVHHFESLRRLWDGAITSISTVDGSATYTGTSLRATLAELMTTFAPTTVRTQDWTIPFGTGDHADHIATALFVQQANRDFRTAHTIYAYGGYPTWTRRPNVFGADLEEKRNAFRAYAAHDSMICLSLWCLADQGRPRRNRAGSTSDRARRN